MQFHWHKKNEGFWFILCFSTHNTHHRTSMPLVRFESAIPAGERPQIHALDRTTTGISNYLITWIIFRNTLNLKCNCC